MQLLYDDPPLHTHKVVSNGGPRVCLYNENIGSVCVLEQSMGDLLFFMLTYYSHLTWSFPVTASQQNHLASWLKI